MSNVRIFVDDEFVAVYKNGKIAKFVAYGDSLEEVLAVLGFEIEYDSDFLLGSEEEDPEIDDVAQTLDEIEDFRLHRVEVQAARRQKAQLESIRYLRQRAQDLLEQADKLERGL